MNNLRREITRSKEDFIKHYRKTYNEPNLPPIWAICEVMSLGLLSRWYDNLKPMKIRKEIAIVYDLDNLVLASFIRHLTEVRNICAHHSRLWNRRFTVTFRLPKRPNSLIELFNPSETRRLYNTLVMLVWFLDIISPNHSWKKRLFNLIEQHQIQVKCMGFPNNYQN